MGESKTQTDEILAKVIAGKDTSQVLNSRTLITDCAPYHYVLWGRFQYRHCHHAFPCVFKQFPEKEGLLQARKTPLVLFTIYSSFKTSLSS